MGQHADAGSAAMRGLDTWDDATILGALWRSQDHAVRACETALPAIARAASGAAERPADGGRLAYAGAGSSGRIAAQDAAELGPTFDWPEARAVLLMAGGLGALTAAVEDAEDDSDRAQRMVADADLGPADVLVAVAASGRTPFTLAGITAAHARGALTIAVANTPGTPLLAAASHAILVETGAEVIAGSTRLAAGTAQKIVLNLFSTLLMTRLGRVHDGRMVDMRLSNAKLRRRATAMVGDLAGCDPATAEAALRQAGGIKAAILVARGLDRDAARALLARHGDVLRPALAEVDR